MVEDYILYENSAFGLLEGGMMLSSKERVNQTKNILLNIKNESDLLKILITITPREEKVLKLRLGLMGHKKHTLEEIGKTYHVTKERIRQIEAKALRKLKHPKRRKALESFTNEF